MWFLNYEDKKKEIGGGKDTTQEAFVLQFKRKTNLPPCCPHTLTKQFL